MRAIKVTAPEGAKLGDTITLAGHGAIGRIVDLDCGVAVVELLGQPAGVAEDGTLVFRGSAQKPWMRGLHELTDPADIRVWAVVHIRDAIEDHPNKESREAALLGLGILLAGAR